MNIAILLAMLGLAIGCTPVPATSWNEEVQLSDGRVVRIERIQHWDPRQQIGRSKYYLSTKVLLKVGSAASASWSGFAERPLLLGWDGAAGEYFLVTVPTLCQRYEELGRPSPPYLQYRQRAFGWQRVDFDHALIGRKPNLLMDLKWPDAGPEAALVSISDKEARNATVPADLYSQIRGEGHAC